MTYTTAQSAEISKNCERVASDLQKLMLEGLCSINGVSNEKARQHMTHGVGRRLGAIRRSMTNIFGLFPPSRITPLPRDTIEDIQINLQAFIINAYGVFDNWAWAFVFRHGLLPQVGHRTKVGLFKTETTQFLPVAVADYLAGATISTWHDDYLKGYRDALAHRIPVYLPPAVWTDSDKSRYEELERQKRECIANGEWERLDQVWNEQDVVGKACPTIMHEYSNDPDARPVYLHPQLICDGAAVAEFGNLFLAHWHDRR